MILQFTSFISINALSHFLNDYSHSIKASFASYLNIKKSKMETTLTTSLHTNASQNSSINLWSKLLIITDNQADNKTAWFLVSLIFQGVLFLPIPAVLMYYYQAPIVVLPITFGLFMSNVIVGMGGSNIRVVLGMILLSIITNLTMLAIYIF
jgi:hypothetical protein